MPDGSSGYEPAPEWKGHNFEEAEKAYEKVIERGRREAELAAREREQDPNQELKQLERVLPRLIETQSTCPFFLSIDVTGSMGENPKKIRAKCPYLDHEVKKRYLGKDVEYCFMATGDAHENDSFPLQAQNFVKNTGIKTAFDALTIEGHGGSSNTCEDYGLGALYLVHNVSMPKAIRPVVIFIGDEEPWDDIPKDMAEKFTYGKAKKRFSDKEIFARLKERYSVYLIRMPYGPKTSGNTISKHNERIHEHWARLIGENNIATMPDASRVVDVIFGLLAKETDKLDYFRSEIEARQTPEQVATVYRSLHL